MRSEKRNPLIFIHCCWSQTLNLPRLLAELGHPVIGHASMPRAQAIEATTKTLRRAKIQYHPDRVNGSGPFIMLDFLAGWCECKCECRCGEPAIDLL